MPKSPRPNITLQTLYEDIAKTMDRLDVLEAYKTHAGAHMKRVADLVNDLETRVSAAERELAKRPKPAVFWRLRGKRR